MAPDTKAVTEPATAPARQAVPLAAAMSVYQAIKPAVPAALAQVERTAATAPIRR
jgi:hypothetical protein